MMASQKSNTNDNTSKSAGHLLNPIVINEGRSLTLEEIVVRIEAESSQVVDHVSFVLNKSFVYSCSCF